MRTDFGVADDEPVISKPVVLILRDVNETYLPFIVLSGEKDRQLISRLINNGWSDALMISEGMGEKLMH